jgi:hypothetical protein
MSVVLPVGANSPGPDAEGTSEMVAFGKGNRPPVPPVLSQLLAVDEASMIVVTDSKMVELLHDEGRGRGLSPPVPPTLALLVAEPVAVE